jgi:Ser-tRNA(Ala) deacylase AlaX
MAGLTDEGGIVLDQSIFYPTGGGQPGDSGHIIWPGGPHRDCHGNQGDGSQPRSGENPIGAAVSRHRPDSVDPDRRRGPKRRGDTIDLQPGGGAHVARTGQIGPVTFGRIEKKGRINRRVALVLG